MWLLLPQVGWEEKSFGFCFPVVSDWDTGNRLDGQAGDWEPSWRFPTIFLGMWCSPGPVDMSFYSFHWVSTEILRSWRGVWWAHASEKARKIGDTERFALSDRSSEGACCSQRHALGVLLSHSPFQGTQKLLRLFLAQTCGLCYPPHHWFASGSWRGGDALQCEKATKSDKEDENGWILSPWKNLSPNNSSNQCPFFVNFTQDLPASR